jgi:transcriptional regulator with XRE-family HTH domain
VPVETKAVGKRIRELRDKRGWSQTRLAFEMGLTPITISGLRTRPSAGNLFYGAF